MLEEASWDEALDLVADKLVEYRGATFGSLASAKGTNEDGYVIQKFVRSVMDTNNVDHCTRLCHSPSVHAMLQSLGSGATSNSYVDYENAGCLMVVGSDSSSNHPVVTVRFRRAVKRGAVLIVVNPKWTELNYYADIWLRRSRAPTWRCSTAWPTCCSTRAWPTWSSSRRAPKGLRTGRRR